MQPLGAFAAAALLLCLSACAGGRYGRSAWNGRRGYDGNGDYGYDLAASRSEARGYRASAARYYPAPGPQDDPWGPYIREAAARYRVPERWVRAVMQQESGGRLYASDGSLITSDAGAMGLMQIMPATYDILRQHYGLGDDPYEPHDNILAGAAYIREMYDRFGAPAFLAAYNAGPDRVDAYLAGGAVLPDETVNYLASVSPQLGGDVPMTGPLAAYATPSAADRAYAGGGMTGSDYYAGNTYAQNTYAQNTYAQNTFTRNTSPPASSYAAADAGSNGENAADRAYDGGGLVTDAAPTGVTEATLGAPAAYVPPPPSPREVAPAGGYGAESGGVAVAYRPAYQGFRAVGFQTVRPVTAAIMLTPVAAPGSPPAGWGIQVGAFTDAAISRAAIATARARAATMLAGAREAVVPVMRGTLLYRARLTDLSADAATAACSALVRDGMQCLTVPPGS